MSSTAASPPPFSDQLAQIGRDMASPQHALSCFRGLFSLDADLKAAANPLKVRSFGRAVECLLSMLHVAALLGSRTAINFSKTAFWLALGIVFVTASMLLAFPEAFLSAGIRAAASVFQDWKQQRQGQQQP